MFTTVVLELKVLIYTAMFCKGNTQVSYNDFFFLNPLLAKADTKVDFQNAKNLRSYFKNLQ
jgi:hypothetical protein